MGNTQNSRRNLKKSPRISATSPRFHKVSGHRVTTRYIDLSKNKNSYYLDPYTTHYQIYTIEMSQKQNNVNNSQTSLNSKQSNASNKNFNSNSTNNLNTGKNNQQKQPAKQSQQQPQQAQKGKQAMNNKNMNSNNNLRRSPTQSNDSSGGRIVRRQLWWHESESEKKVHIGSLPKFDAGPKVDDKSNWSPSRSTKRIETRRLQWNVQPVLNTKENLNYVPGGK